MSSVSDIKDQIKTIMEGVDGVDQAFDNMPRYIDKNISVGVYYSGGSEEHAEVGSHWAHYEFDIIAFIYMFDETTIQETQETLCESMLSALRAEPSLNGTCLSHIVERWENSYAQLANGNVYATVEMHLIADVEEDD